MMRNKLIAALLALAIASPVPAQFISPRPAPLAIPNYTANGGLPIWEAARAKVIAGTANNFPKILVISESTSVWGAAWQTNDLGYSRPITWPSQLAQILSMAPYNIPASSNSVIGEGIGSGTTAQYVAMDQRLTVGTGWSFSTSVLAGLVSIGGGYWDAGTTNQTIAFDCSNSTQFPTASQAPCNTDTFTFIWNKYGNTDVTTLAVNGGAALATLTDSGSGTVVPSTITATLGHNVWDVNCTTIGSSIGCSNLGWYAYNSAVSQALILNGGWAGSTVVNWTTNNGFAADPLATIQTLAPALCIIMIAGNDSLRATVSGAANNGSGLIRLTVSSTSNLATGQSALVSAVGGTTEANATWTITVIDGTHIDLQGSAFVHAYTSGGIVGTGIPLFTTDKQAMISACKVSGDVLLVTSQPPSPLDVPYSTFINYVTADISLATSNNIPVLNLFQTLCNYSAGSCLGSSPSNAGGWYSGKSVGWWAQNFGNSDVNDPHLGPPAHMYVARQIADVLSQ